ncbi:glycosyltransferase [Nocardia niigatensis]
MAVRNARPAVRLTVRSFLRCTPEPVRILVADNGSTDGAADETLLFPDVEVVPLERRPSTHSPADLTRHSVALDDLAASASSRYVLCLDSDVEFLRVGWLSQLLSEADNHGLAAVGEYEPAIGCYQPRLAPHMLLVRTAAIRAYGLSFAGYAAVDDPEEAARFVRRPHESTYRLTLQEVTSYRSARIYPPGAKLLEMLTTARLPWRPMPKQVLASYNHLGHMSWGDADPDLVGEHRNRLEYLRRRLQAYPDGEVPEL